jgi:hypothetical protein
MTTPAPSGRSPARLWTKLLALALSVVAAIGVAEVLLRSFRDTSATHRISGPEWAGSLAEHPDLGAVYRPHSEMRTYYPDNPRGYFLKDDRRAGLWNLRVGAGNDAALVFPAADPDAVRVDIRQAASPAAYDVQVNHPHLALTAGRTYRVVVRLRAPAPRPLAVGVARAHAPWDGLGLYQPVTAGPDAETSQFDFVASATDDNARVHFDLGGSAVPVEIAAFQLVALPAGTRVDAPQPDRFYVAYQFNALGCRGPDYAIPRPAGTSRVLILGDSYTLGAGVHEPDTFARQLEPRLQEHGPPSGRVEVINCGVSGYSTREEALFYRLIGARYEPDVVLVVMVFNDDMSFLDEVRRGYVNRQPDRLEAWSRVWAALQDFRYRRPRPDFSGSVTHVRELDRDVRANGARLALVIFRDACLSGSDSRPWDRLADTVRHGLQGASIPVLDFKATADTDAGRSLCAKYSETELLVHSGRGDAGLDGHPNEIVHRALAAEIAAFFERERLLRRP